MPNEFVAKNGLVAQNNSVVSGSLVVTNGITGSLFGTSSQAISASYTATASFAQNTSDILLYVKNSSGAQINKGRVVRITGAVGDNALIGTASYTDDNNSANTLGITFENIANDSFGYVITEGTLLGINTDAFTAGQLIYLGDTGSIIGTAPVAPLHAVRLGQVLRSQLNNGSIYVRIDNGFELGELHDVRDTTTTGSYGDLLIKSGSIWINSKQLTGSYGLTGSLNVSGSITGSLFGTSSQAISASYAFTASSASNAFSASFAQTSSFANNFTVANTLTAQTLVVSTISSSVVYSSGSNIFGNSLSNTQVLTGSVGITGSLTVRGNEIISGSSTITGSLTVSSGITGSLFGTASQAVSSSFAFTASSAISSSLTQTASFALRGNGSFTGSFSGSVTASLFGTASQATSASFAFTASSAISASFASTASFVNTLNQNVVITGSLIVGSGSIGAIENTLTLGARDTANEGGQLGFNAPGGTYTSASMLDLYQNRFRLLRGTNTGSIGEVLSANLNTNQIAFTSYTSAGAFPGTVVANLAVDSGGNILTVAAGTVTSASYAFTASSAVSSSYAYTASSATTASTVIATVTGTNSTELVRGNMADNDQFRILVGGTATNAGFAEIATADDGTEPIHVRQYTGVFSSLVRTATLLDGSGNTSFPGIVSATFSGSFTGSFSGSVTASLFGTASQAISSSFAFTASSAISSSFAVNYLGSGSISTRLTNLETASGSFSTRLTNTETTASNLVAASASFSTRITSDSSSFSSRVSSIEATTASLQVASGSFSTRVTQIERTYATTGSNIFTGSQNILGAITASAALINGTITAQTLVVTTVSSSVVFSSGSNIFGNSTANTQTMTGSLNVSGSATIVGRVTATDLTGSLFGTASWATNFITGSVTSASFAFTASSAISSSLAQTASSVNTLTQAVVISGSFTVVTGSSIEFQVTNTGIKIGNLITDSHNLTGSLNVLGSITGSLSGSITGSLFGTASQATSASYAFTASSAISSSYALTASFALNGGGGASFPYTGSAQITGSLGVTGSFSVSANQGSSVFSSNADTLLITGSLVITGSGAITGSLSVSSGITGSLFGTASQAVTASYALTASFVASIAGLSTSQIATGSVTASVGQSTASFQIVSGSTNFLYVSNSGNIGIGTTTPTSYGSRVVHVHNAAASVTFLKLSNSTTGTGLNNGFEVGNSGATAYVYNRENASLIFGTAGNDRVVITGAGSMGVGTSTPSASLEVSGSLRITNGLSNTGSVNISGSTLITGSLNVSGAITTNGTITAQTLVVQTITSSITYSSGSNIFGNALTNTQTMTGSVNITGSLTLNGNQTTFGVVTVQSASFDYGQNLSVSAGGYQVIASEATSSFRCAFFDYVMFSGSIVRAGTVTSTWSGSATEYYENYTADLGGSTSGVLLQTAISAGNIQLQASASTAAWTIRSLIRLL